MALKRISDLVAAPPLTGTEEVELDLGGGVSGKCTTQDIADLGGTGSGDVAGPASSVDNTLPRFNGTTGKIIQASGVAVDDDNKISGYAAADNDIAGTTYTLLASDTGKRLRFTSGSSVAVTLPNNLPVGWCCSWTQVAGGQVTFTAASGATRQNRQSHTKSAGQWAKGCLEVDTNAGSAAVYVLAGDTAP